MGYSTFTQKMGQIFMDKLEEVYQRQEADPNFLKREDYPDCRSRAEAGIMIAVAPVVDTAGYAIAVHDERSHGIDTMDEQSALLAAEADPTVEDEVRGFWNG